MNTHRKSFVFGMACALGMLWTTANANELVATIDQAKKGSANVSIDFASSGAATAFEFEVAVPKGAVVDTKNCVSEVPSSHVGACKYDQAKGKVVVMVYSNTNAKLPEGIVPVGRIAVSGKAVQSVRVENILVADAQAGRLDAKVSTFAEVK